MAASITLSDAEEPEAAKAVLAGIVAYNERHAGPVGHRPLNLIVRRDGEAEVAGGLIGATWFGWLHIQLLHLPQEMRGQGLGSELLRRAEAEARARGCLGILLDTFSFQARPFYERHGFAVFATLEDDPPGHRRHYMSKRLDGAAPRRPDHVQS